MTEPADDAPAPAAEAAAEAAAAATEVAAEAAAAAEAARRRRLAEVFGDVLPESPDEPTAAARDERWYRENRPPHHE
ncbi:hypothetical protein GCM10010492_12680 [Saccharothrix mutabilis subsp. mutabilis]|uniref:Uncharacterized protein n=1 Tax=Saccharothrix mutabilis subsp. mutabilis TaxID=66855 RepID=A0ABN0TA37_9PSEU